MSSRVCVTEYKPGEALRILLQLVHVGNISFKNNAWSAI